MNLKVSYSDLILLNNDVLENVERLIEYGADKIELMMDGEKWNEMEALFDSLADQLNKLPVEYSVHPPAWDINLTSENKEIRKASFIEYKKAIEFASAIHASHVVIHPGFCFSPVFSKEIAKQRAHDYINQLCEIAEPLNVRLAVENVGYNGASIYTQEEYVDCLNHVNDIAGFLIDVGHAQLNGWNISELIYSVKDRLIGLHLHDNDGFTDEHLPIQEGKMDWEKIMKTLHDHHIPCELILEYAPETPLETLKKGKDFLNKSILI